MTDLCKADTKTEPITALLGACVGRHRPERLESVHVTRATRDGLGPARGIAAALVLVLPFWGVIASFVL